MDFAKVIEGGLPLMSLLHSDLQLCPQKISKASPTISSEESPQTYALGGFGFFPILL